MSAGGLSVRLTQHEPIPLAVELDCAPGELLALTGPSGSGKSTVLRAIAGLVRPRAGRIVCGDDVWFDPAAGVQRTPQQRSVGLVFQHYALFPHLSALHNVTAALGQRTRLRAGTGLHTQSPGYEKLIQSDYFLDLTDVGRLDLEPERAWHFVLGVGEQDDRVH